MAVNESGCQHQTLCIDPMIGLPLATVADINYSITIDCYILLPGGFATAIDYARARNDEIAAGHFEFKADFKLAGLSGCGLLILIPKNSSLVSTTVFGLIQSDVSIGK